MQKSRVLPIFPPCRIWQDKKITVKAFAVSELIGKNKFPFDDL